MKQIFLAILSIALIYLTSCNGGSKENKNTADSVAVEQVKYPNTKTFYKVEKPDDAIIFADTIIYDVVLQNSQYGREWTNECSYNTVAKTVDIEAITNTIFQAIYKNRLTPYDLFTGEVMTVAQVKELVKKHKISSMAKMEFNEEWYFNENTLEMSKRIRDISFGFEKTDEAGNVLSYYPAFKVYLNNPDKNPKPQ